MKATINQNMVQLHNPTAKEVQAAMVAFQALFLVAPRIRIQGVFRGAAIGEWDNTGFASLFPAAQVVSVGNVYILATHKLGPVEVKPEKADGGCIVILSLPRA